MLALSGHTDPSARCLLSGVKQTSSRNAATSEFDPKGDMAGSVEPVAATDFAKQQEVVSKASTVHNVELLIRECHLEGINVYEAQICNS